METEYVYRNVYDIEVRRIDEKIENAITRMEAKSDAYMARIEGVIAHMHGEISEMCGEISEMRGEVKAVSAQVSNMGWTIILTVALVGLVLTCVNIYFAIPH